MINTCLLLECFSVWRPLNRTVLPGQELHLRRFFEQDSGDAGFFYRRADDDDAVILQEQRPGRSERRSHSLAEGWSHDQIARLCETRQSGGKQGIFSIRWGVAMMCSKRHQG
jgi:hypothetical protein